MALGKYSRVDGRKSSSNYCSTVSIVVFVALCLVGVWMMTSSSVVPVQNSDSAASQQDSKGDVVNEGARVSEVEDTEESKPDVTENDSKANNKQFEDNPGDLPDDATKGDNTANSDQEDKKPNTETKLEDGNEDGKDKSDDVPKTEDDKKKNPDDKESGGGEESTNDGEQKSDENTDDARTVDFADGQTEVVKNATTPQSELLPSGANSELLNETQTQNGAFKTQSDASKNEKEGHKSADKESVYSWKLCNVTAGPDFIPCLDNLEAIKHLHSTKHYEHRERHCPENPPTCLVPVPEGYQRTIEWPASREKIWYHNVPHIKLAQVKGHQNWVKVSGEYLTFPGGGTQFKHGALHYIDFIQQSVPDIAWGKRSRVVLDVGCGVASFGGFLFDRDVLTMSLAPKDEHEAQVQFALERGIPGISGVMGTQRLPFPGRVFDIVHCARCRVPWHIEGGKLLLELNRLLRPGGFFVWSATPVYQKNNAEDVEIWNEMKKLTAAMCWEVISIIKDKVNSVGIAIYRKPSTNECYEERTQKEPPLCQESDDPDAAWNVPLQACLHKIPVGETERGSQWPVMWPARVGQAPYWLLSSQVGAYGKPAPQDFSADFQHWTNVVTKSYMNGLGINWSTVRNVMDMRAVYGGFAAALKEMKVWVMNIVSIDAPDTLPIIYERGLFGIYHDWCESFSTYPRTYDLLHADHLFSKIKKRCNFEALVAEVDRILRPEGKIIVRDHSEILNELEVVFKSMHYEIRMTYSKDKEGLLFAQKTSWRPKELETLTYAIE